MQDRLSRLTKVAYGTGDLGFSLCGTIIGAYFAIFLTDVAGLTPAVAAAAIFAGRSWDYLNDPLIGYASDRTRSRWGRRRPFLLFGAIPFGIAFCLLWWKPPLAGALLAVYYGAAYLLFDTAATFIYMPYYALTPELTSSYDERTSLTTYRMFFSILGGLIAFTVPLMIVGSFRPENAPRILANGALFGALAAVPMFLVVLAVRERREFSAAPPPRPLAALKAAAANRPLRFGLGIYLFTAVTIDIMQTILLYFLTWCVRRESDSDLLMGAIFVTAMLALPLWSAVSRRWSKRAAYIGGIAFWAAVQLAIITLGPTTSLPVLVVLCVLAGIGVGAAHVLPWAILPDAVEWDEWKTGERHEGTFYSLVTLAQKVASSIAIPLALLLLGAFGYQSGALEQPQSALLAIRLITGPIPAVLLCLGIVCAAFYPLDRRTHARILEELAKRRAAGGGAP